MPSYLNAAAQGLLDEARASYRRLLLGERELVDWGADTLVFCWRGDRILNTLAIALNQAGLRVSIGGVALTVTGATPAGVLATIAVILAAPQPVPEALAASVLIKEREKYDQYLSDDLLARGYAAANLDVPGAWETLRHLAATQVTEDTQSSWDRGNASSVTPQTSPVLGVTPFAVVDVETTGFASQDDDRVIEIAVVHCDPAGKVTGRWTTLIDACRDPGPTHVHGITAEELVGAPVFADLTDWLSELTARRVVVAHNAPFDLAFLAAEHERADVDTPAWASLCTLELTGIVGLGNARSLQECCAAAQITLTGAHSALGDAQATADLLAHCLELARQQGITDLTDLGCRDALPSPASDRASRQPHLQPRTMVKPLDTQAVSMALLVSRGHAQGSLDAAANSYLALVDSVLVASRNGHRLDRQGLLRSARALGIETSNAAALLDSYLASLLASHPTIEQEARLRGLQIMV